MSDVSYLVLANGKIFKGKSFGYDGEIFGEVVFSTGMTGYLETLTDKSYYGQLVVMTFPLIGNYGVIPFDFESDKVSANAYIVKHWCQEPSNFRSEGNLDAFLKAQNVIGLHGIDTRALTKIIRENGVMNGFITKSIDNIDYDKLKAYQNKDAITNVTTSERYSLMSESGKYKVVILDFGLKKSIISELVKRHCDVVVLPSHASARDIISLNPDGVMLSNGPGNPADYPEIVSNIKELLKSNIPIFGICIGHQLLALANGITSSKLKYGHRGGNQPVKERLTGKVYITSQSHGYSVASAEIAANGAKEIFTNVNDLTCEGIEYLNYPAFSVQFHPEACAGPRDTMFLFDRFISMMGGNK